MKRKINNNLKKIKLIKFCKLITILKNGQQSWMILKTEKLKYKQKLRKIITIKDRKISLWEEF